MPGTLSLQISFQLSSYNEHQPGPIFTLGFNHKRSQLEPDDIPDVATGCPDTSDRPSRASFGPRANRPHETREINALHGTDRTEQDAEENESVLDHVCILDSGETDQGEQASLNCERDG